ncbi:putative MAPEG superfamily protein [Albidovulum inexpectatum]|uniref:Putative MAPEG superfamily protein n=1 Tax=Albidovulum inexpectatum TaxID=196587 RepID=A0A2S5JL38_9RHOB|nr:MAPEG family protein [Albidovulum inexpectatum]PPB82160.1 putative MAPEG superfamily protein [Albidovulum inexpectatum]
MSSELNILALYGLYTALVLILKVSGMMSQLGMGYLLSSRDEQRSLRGITGRLDRALSNSITAMTLFAPAILILAAKDAFTPGTLTAAKAFLLARVLYVPAYGFGIIGLRTLLWLAGFAATVFLYLVALAA